MKKSFINAALMGFFMGLIVISLFVLGEDGSEWGKYWKIRPLIITPLVGAFGGLGFNFIFRLKKLNRMLAYLLSIAFFIFSLWIGVVLGLDGTLWD